MKKQPQDTNEYYEWWQDFVKLHGKEPENKFNRNRYEDKEIPAYMTNSKVRESVDCRLRKIANITAQMGIDSNDDEKREIYQERIKLANEIKSIDPLVYEELFPSKDINENY